MPATSQSQQKLFGMAYRCKKDNLACSGAVKKLVDTMSLKDLKKMAIGTHDSLPKKVNESLRELSFKDFLSAAKS